MLVQEPSLEHQLLDLLVDAPSPLGAVFRSLVLYCGYPRELDVSQVVNTLIRMERKGWVRAWQVPGDGTHHEASGRDLAEDLEAYKRWITAETNLDDLSVDEVGLWHELTDIGREEWSRYYRKEVQGKDRAWMLDDVRDAMTLVIHASSDEAAEEALTYWLSVNPGIQLFESSRSLQHVSGFRLRNGALVPGGTKLTCRYFQTAPPGTHRPISPQ